jgi:hypothetical protein
MMAVRGVGEPSLLPYALEAEAHQCAEPLLEQACISRALDCERVVASPLHNTRPEATVDRPGSPVDGASAARQESAAARITPRSAAAGSRQSSPEAPAASLHDGSAGAALRDTLSATTATQAEYSHDDGNGSDVQVSALLSVPGRSNRGHVGSLSEPGDEVLVERKLRRARQRPLAERRSRRYSKPQSFVG